MLLLPRQLTDGWQKTGKITYCGHELNEFIPRRTSAYISQHDLHYGEMTVRETLDFSGRCLGVGTRYELLAELSRREKESAVKPDPEIDAFMKATALAGQETSLVTDYIVKVKFLLPCSCGRSKWPSGSSLLIADFRYSFLHHLKMKLKFTNGMW